MLCRAGLLHAGDKLTSKSNKYPATATITDRFTIQLDNDTGAPATSLSSAANRALARAGSSRTSSNGWVFWLHDGKPLSDIREAYRASDVISAQGDEFCADFWNGFYSHCLNREDFVEAYGDQSDRAPNTENWTSFGIGQIKFHPEALLNRKNDTVGVRLYFTDADAYSRLLAHRGEAESLLASLGGDIAWDAAVADKKTRHMRVTRAADLGDGWDEAYRWLEDALLMMRRVAALADK